MTDESLILDIDIIDMEHEKEVKRIVAEKDSVIAEKDNAIAEKDNVIAEQERELILLRRQLREQQTVGAKNVGQETEDELQI